MLPKADVRRALRFTLSAARLGGACLALAIVVSEPAPEVVLALLAILFLIVGGASPDAVRSKSAIRWVGPVVAVLLARVTAGPGAALLAALLIGLGAWLRVGLTEASAGLAVFGVSVAVLGGAPCSIILSFWLAGAGLVVIGHTAGAAVRRLDRVFLKGERTARPSLR